ncbi:MAG: hypothetical protein KF866_06695 [Phycisphaeraceae bacterium]|nr:hypothetical protein [Phycisphaeraceae bacterium]
MALIYVGIDEAGYGPLLGPFCSAMTVWRVEGWREGDPAPDLWKMLARVVTPTLKGARGRIPLADSKAIKLANSARQPLVHLERGVLACLLTGQGMPRDDAELLERLGGSYGQYPWYGGGGLGLPLANTPELLAIDANLLSGAMAEAGVSLVAARCCVVDEGRFNETVRRTNSKGEVALEAFAEHVRSLGALGLGEAPVRIVGDRLGGRVSYGGFLSSVLGGEVRVLEETARVSRYESGRVVVQFLPEAESHHLPVALASMTAKFVRELAMLRFNRYWCARCVELKPTAGYRQDAGRWLRDVAGILTPDERRALTRLA